MSVSTRIQAPRGAQMSCKGWHQEAALRMLHNNLDPEVAEDPEHLIVYGGTGRAARASSGTGVEIPSPNATPSGLAEVALWFRDIFLRHVAQQ